MNNIEKLDYIGECTSGDMDMNRHGKKEYINNFPCRYRCLKCGTFWFD